MPSNLGDQLEVYKLPDGTSFKMPEDIESNAHSLFFKSDRSHNTTFYELLNTSIQKISDNKIDGKLFNSLILTGGNTLVEGFLESTKDNVKNICQVYQLPSKIFAFPTDEITSHSVWIGGSIFSSIDNFLQFYITKAELAEYGESIVDRKLL